MEWIFGGLLLLLLLGMLKAFPGQLIRFAASLNRENYWLAFIDIAWPLAVIGGTVWALLAVFGIV